MPLRFWIFGDASLDFLSHPEQYRPDNWSRTLAQFAL